MELKRRLDLRICLTVIYVLVAAVYLFVGLQPANAEGYEISSRVVIPEAGLSADVTRLELANNALPTPDFIAGSFSRAKNKTLLIGHSTTAFSELWRADIGDEIIYDGRKYEVKLIEVYEKSGVNMNEILEPEDVDTVVLMTCEGELLPGGDATHRLVVTATIAK